MPVSTPSPAMFDRRFRCRTWMVVLCLLAGVFYGCATTAGTDGESPTQAPSAEAQQDRPAERTETAQGEEPNRGGSVDLASRDPQVALQRLRTDEGYRINLYASEQQFPELANVTQMTWDGQGRLWASVMPSYPHHVPGEPPNDKIIILEDTSRDGRADRLTVFADSLYLPGGFELGDGGVYVAQQPDLLFLEDTDGDDRADTRERILHGFGTGDSHHSISAFEWGPDGALYLMEGTFLYSQVETPYGPERLRYGGVWRYHPKTEKLDLHVSYPFANPWGQTFDFWGQNFLFDASGGANYFALPITGAVEYPQKHVPMRVYTEWVRPTAGGEIIRNPHFPDSVQGNLLINNVIGFQGVKHHRVVEEGSGYNSEEVEPLLYSLDRNFRPVDLQFGPDGALYIVDWWNPLIGHMQYSLRDPRRDASHGRIWRVTYPDRPLLEDPAIAGRSADELLDLLTEYTDRHRVLYRVRRELWSRPREEVMSALEAWVPTLDPSDDLYEHHLLEALWAYQSHHVVREELLRQLLRADRYQVRAAATRVLRYWQGEVDGALALFEQQVNDAHPRVRLEAVVALSYHDSADAAAIALQALQYPVDYYLDYGLRETMKALEEAWRPALAAGEAFSAENSRGMQYVLEQLETAELAEMVQGAPHPAVHRELLRREAATDADRRTALEALAQAEGQSEIETLLQLLAETDASADGLNELSDLLLARGADELASHRDQLRTLAIGGASSIARQTGFAVLITVQEDAAWALASKSRRGLHDFLKAVPRVDATARTVLYDRVRPVVETLPSGLGERPVQADVVEIVGRSGAARQTPPRITLLDAAGSETQRAEAFERVDMGVWRAPWDGGTARQLVVDVQEEAYPARSLDAYTVLARDADGSVVFSTVPDRAYVRSNNLSYGEVSKGPMGNRYKPPLRGTTAIPTADTIAVGGDLDPDALHQAAIQALASIPGHPEITFRTLKEQVVEGNYVYEAVAGINQIPSAEWPEEELAGFGQAVLDAAQNIPLAERADTEFQEVVTLGLALASRLSGDERVALERNLNSLVTIVTIEAVPGEMRYDKTEFSVPAGKPVVIVLKNPDALDHNLVIVEPGFMEEVGQMGDAMAGDPDAYEKDFVPDSDRVLWASDLIGSGEEDQLSFIAPEDPGDYPYECTFPGHWRTMNGIMTVTGAGPATNESSP